MPITTPEPRLPLEPEEYPLYRPPSRIGCSALAILPILLIAVFLFLFWRVTPGVADRMVSPVRDLLGIAADTTPESTPGTGALATQTVDAIATSTVALPTPTAVVEYVQVANTGGSGVRLRREPRNNADTVVVVGEGAKFMVIGPDQENADGKFRHVELPNDGRQGWVKAEYLIPTTWP
jgi:hypothetical protein